MARRANGRPRGLERLSSQELEAELRRRERLVGKLMRRHAALSRRLNAIEEQIEAMGGAVSGGGRRRAGAGRRTRPKNTKTLIDALAEVLKGKTMTVTEVSEAVQRAGYRTNAENFRTIVNQALIRATDRFKKVGRGQYTAK